MRRNYLSGGAIKTTSTPYLMNPIKKKPLPTEINTGIAGRKKPIMSKERFIGLRNKGLSLEQIQKFESGYVPKKQNFLQRRTELDTKHAETYKPTFPIQAGQETLLSAPLKAVGNIPSSAFQLGKAITGAVTKPVETIKGLGGLVSGIVQKGAEKVITAFEPKLKEPLKQVPETEEGEMAKMVGQSLKQRYGSLDAVQRTVGNDPVGFALDVLATAQAGASAAGKTSQLNRAIAKTGQAGAKAIQKIAKPISKITKPIRKIPEELITGTIGTLTGKGTEVFKQALKPTNEFFDAIRGKTSGSKIVDIADEGFKQIQSQRNKQYVDDIGRISKNNPKALDISPVTNSVDDILKQFNIKRTADGLDLSRSALVDKAKTIESLVNNIDDWGTKIGDRSIKGVDMLKQQIGSFYSNDPQLNKLVSSFYNKTKGVLSDVPEYSKAMGKYEGYSKFINELKFSLGTGKNLTIEQKLTKIRQLLSDNKDYRRVLAQEFKTMTNKDLLQMVSGYQLRPFSPSGLGKFITVGSGAGFGMAGNIPALIGTAMGSSPRIMGELLSTIGITGQKSKMIINALGNIKSTAIPTAGLLRRVIQKKD